MSVPKNLSPRRPLRRRPEQQEQSTGLQKTTGSSEPEFLLVGRIARPHGVRGEVGMRLMTEHPEHLLTIKKLYVGSEHKAHKVVRMRRHHDGMIIHFADFTDRDHAEALREAMVYISIKDAVPLEAGEYYLYQIEKMRVVSDEGEELGRVTGLIETGANDVYVITTPEGKELLLPAIPDVIKQVDVENDVMTVHLLEGLR